MYSDILYIYKLGGEMTKMGDHNNDSRATRTDYCGTTDGTRVRFGLVYFIFSLTWLTRVVIDGSGTSMY
jgi:hypothetical protein